MFFKLNSLSAFIFYRNSSKLENKTAGICQLLRAT